MSLCHNVIARSDIPHTVTLSIPMIGHCDASVATKLSKKLGMGSFGSPDNGSQLPGSEKIEGGVRPLTYHGPRDRVP